MTTAEITLDLSKLSKEELLDLQSAVNTAIGQHSVDKKAAPYVELETERKALEKEIKAALDASKKFTFELNLPLTFEVEVYEECSFIPALASGDDLLSFEGGVKMPSKTIDGLTKKQSDAVKEQLSDYTEVCGDFLRPFIPEEFAATQKALQKKAENWMKKVKRYDYLPSDFFDTHNYDDIEY